MDKGFHIGMILVVLENEFDTLHRTVLLQKMKCIGFKELAIKWFQSRLSNRNFFVTLKDVFSDTGQIVINCGIHGSLLFLIYKDDLPQVLNETGSYCYADETCIFYQDKDAEKVGKELNTEFLSLCEWFIDKKLYN